MIFRSIPKGELKRFKRITEKAMLDLKSAHRFFDFYPAYYP